SAAATHTLLTITRSCFWFWQGELKGRTMRKLTVTICALATMITTAYGGTTTYSGKEQVAQVPPCPEWYRDTEWNVSLWGTYVFTANNWRDDRYFQSDHAWGGGVDVKYFFHRYFGVGLEGWATESTRQRFDGFDFNGQPAFSDDQRVIGAVKGTLTLRYPIHCSRFSPYLYGGGGALFGGEEHTSFTILFSSSTIRAVSVVFPATHTGSTTRGF